MEKCLDIREFWGVTVQGNVHEGNKIKFNYLWIINDPVNSSLKTTQSAGRNLQKKKFASV